MQRKFVPIVISILVLAGVALVYFGSRSKDDPSINTDSGSQKSDKPKIVDACSVLTQQIADGILNGASEQASLQSDSQSNDISVSTCTYTLDTNSGIPISPAKIKTAQLLARSSKNLNGSASNKQQFGDKKPAAAEDVSGYGQAAYWERTTGQLNILKNNNWYILTNGAGAIDSRRLDDAKKLADQIISNL